MLICSEREGMLLEERRKRARAQCTGTGWTLEGQLLRRSRTRVAHRCYIREVDQPKEMRANPARRAQASSTRRKLIVAKTSSSSGPGLPSGLGTIRVDRSEYRMGCCVKYGATLMLMGPILRSNVFRSQNGAKKLAV